MSDAERHTKLLLLMTTGLSLKDWKDSGQLDRELKIYQKLSAKIGTVNIYSFGRNDSRYLKGSDRIKIAVEKKSKLWVKNLNPRLTSYFNYCWNIYNLFSEKNNFKSVDIIKTNQFRGSVFGVILKKVFMKPLIVRLGWYHGHFKNPNWNKRIIERWVFKNASKIILTNKFAKNYISDSYRIKSKNILVFPNSINSDLFAPENYHKKYDITYIGRLHKEKNLGLLIKALEKIKIPLRILIIGDGNKDYLNEIKSIKKHQLFYFKCLTNSEIPRYLNESKIFVLLSKYEGNPKTLLEAMSCSLPVIGNDAPGISEIIDNKKNGILINNDPYQLKKTIETILNDRDLRHRLGKEARKYIIENHHIDHITMKEANLINQLTNL